MKGPALPWVPWRVLPAAWSRLMQSLESVLHPGRWRDLGAVLAILVLIWHLYVPVHELMHVWACRVAGGTVAQLALKPRYGGRFLHRIFPFVTPESRHAGQLSRFTVPHDWAYAAVDTAPYLPSLFGLALLEAARRRRSRTAFAAGAILATAPLAAIPGDFHETAALATSRLAQAWRPELPARALVSDDFPELVRQLHASGNGDAGTVLLVALGLAGAVLIALELLVVQEWIARRCFPLPAKAGTAADGRTPPVQPP